MISRLALLALLPLAFGCGTSSLKEKLLPKASVLGVSLVEVTPAYALVKVDIKTDDVDLMLGIVKMKYKMTILDAELGHDVPATELMQLRDSGFAFMVKIPLDKSGNEATKIGYLLQGSIVFKVIAKIADVPFSYQGELALKP